MRSLVLLLFAVAACDSCGSTDQVRAITWPKPMKLCKACLQTAGT